MLGRWWRARRIERVLARRAIPDALWNATLAAYPFIAHRCSADRERLRTLATVFLADKEFTGANGLVITDAMAVAIAAQACLPVLEIGLGLYARTVGIVVQPGEVLARRQLPAYRLEIEITEGTLMTQSDLVLRQLRILRDMGVAVALDDFGTGYSNLMTLFSMPFDILKVDRSFVSGIEDDVPSRALVDMILALARQLRLQVVAEGVETRTQQSLLADLGCEFVQGYLHSPPLPASSFEAMTFAGSSIAA